LEQGWGRGGEWFARLAEILQRLKRCDGPNSINSKPKGSPLGHQIGYGVNAQNSDSKS
jgi:hypothetical protein